MDEAIKNIRKTNKLVWIANVSVPFFFLNLCPSFLPFEWLFSLPSIVNSSPHTKIQAVRCRFAATAALIGLCVCAFIYLFIMLPVNFDLEQSFETTNTLRQITQFENIKTAFSLIEIHKLPSTKCHCCPLLIRSITRLECGINVRIEQNEMNKTRAHRMQQSFRKVGHFTHCT